VNRNEFKAKYLAIIDPIDVRWHYESYEPGLWVKHEIARFVNPKVIVEIGVRSGYSAWAMLQAVPGVRFVGYDNYSPLYAEGFGERLSDKFEQWAHKLLDSLGVTFVKQDSQQPGFVPEKADLYHVDGDHRYEFAKHDIENCIRAGAPNSVIVVHDYLAKCVSDACRDAVKGTDRVVFGIPEARNGDGLITVGSTPEWAKALGF